MKIALNPRAFIVSLFSICLLGPVTPLLAEDIDFSCMKHRVRDKTQVSKSYREFDVLLENQCPGTAYWSMCIERMNPWTMVTLETLTPSGQIEKEKKTRVNLRMKNLVDEANSRQTYEEFYLNIDFAINTAVKADCVASDCESKKRELRAEVKANEKALQKAHKDLTAQIASKCPDSGWGGTEQANCEAGIREAGQATLEQLEQQRKEIDENLAAVEPEKCQVYGGS
jgi:hypothetical protein